MGRVGTVEALKDILQLILRYRRAPCGHGQPRTVVSASCQCDLYRRTWGGVLLCVIQVNAYRLLQLRPAATHKNAVLQVGLQLQTFLIKYRFKRQQGVTDVLAPVQPLVLAAGEALVDPRQFQQLLHQHPHLLGDGQHALRKFAFFGNMKAFIAAVLGGIGIIPGAMLGGILIGLIEIFVKLFAPGWYEAVTYGTLIVILLVKPSGILGKNVGEKV